MKPEIKSLMIAAFALVRSYSSCYAQSAEDYSRKADSLYLAKNYPKAAQLYLSAAKKNEFKTQRQSNYYNAACCYALGKKPDSAFFFLDASVKNGYKDIAHLKEDADLVSLHPMPHWKTFVSALKFTPASSDNPSKAKLITVDVVNFWKAYDLAQKDTAHRFAIYKKYYLDAGTVGLQDYFAYKVGSLRSFVAAHDRLPKFYASIRKNTFQVEPQKQLMIANFIKLKQLYPQIKFPDVYFVIGSFSSGGTSTSNGLLIGLDQIARTPDIPLDELTLWQRNNLNNLSGIPSLVCHELVHFNQDGMASDTSLLRGVLIEGMADFIADLISGGFPNQRLHVWAKGKEKQIWTDFEKEMYLNRAYNWIANSGQETAEKPADLGYWVGYQICKAYYDNNTDKNKAIAEMLNIKNYREFYEKSGAGKLFK